MPSDFFAFVKWYLAISFLGAAALPLVFKFFRRLPDRGYTVVRTLGLLAVSYVFWLLGSLGLLRNDAGGFVFAALVVGVGGVVWLGRGGLAELGAWLKEQWRVVTAVEVLFLAAFAAMALARAYNPQLDSTERPMEFMFINSILRSDTLPPHDAWLSGNPISYYYFGYVMIAALTRLTGLASEVAFNLGFSMLFALTAVGAVGVLMNLITLARQKAQKLPAALLPAFWPALLGPLLVLVVGNFYGVLALVHANGLLADLQIPAVRYSFGAGNLDNQGSGAAAAAQDRPGIQVGWVNVWDWLDLKGLTRPLPAPSPNFVWDPGVWWWFSGARVVHDRNLTGAETEAIDEVPAFSFILGDMHPHVLALPFAMLGVALALDWLLWGLGQAPIAFDLPEPEDEDRAAPLLRRPLVYLRTRLWPGLKACLAWLRPLAGRIFVAALFLGGLLFINTWDFPIYAFLVVMALAMGLALAWGREGLLRHWFFPASLALGMAALSVVLYIPYFLTAQSQVQGILPNLIYPTRFQQTVVMFGPVLIGVTLFVGWLALKNRALFNRAAAWWAGAGVAGLLAGSVLALSLLALAVINLASAFGFSIKGSLLDFALQFVAPLDAGSALGLMFQRRLVDSFATLFPAVMIGLAVGLGLGLLWGKPRKASGKKEETESEVQNPKSEFQNPSVLMALLMVLGGALLLLGPEWLYIHDFFGTRMNTLFKFYYQAWLLWALVSAFGLWYMAQFAGRTARGVMGGLMTLAMAAGLLYTFPGLASKADHFAGPPTLDGMAFFKQAYSDDWAAIQWLRQNVPGTPVLAESTFGAYWGEGRFSRVSMATGLPTILGWRNHEEQWRGVAYIPALRDRERYVCGVYRLGDWRSTQAILDKFDVEYVYVSSLEKDRYRPPNLAKFDQNMRLVFQNGDVKIYQRLAASQPAPADALPDVSKLCTDLVPR